MQLKYLFFAISYLAIGLFMILAVGCEKEDDSQDLTVTDVDGNVYHAVKIGSQVWMVENLKTTRYNDSTDITMVEDSALWNHLTEPACCWMNNDLNNKEPYGALYNWYAVNTGKLCPDGWHIPTNDEWTILIDYLGGMQVAGGKLKEAGMAHWIAPNEGASNSSGFTALPGGCRVTEEYIFLYFNFAAYWWTSSEESSQSALWWKIDYSNTNVIGYNLDKNYGFSVRCIKDDE